MADTVPVRIRVLHVVETMLGMGGLERGLVNLIHRTDASRFEHVVCVVRSLGALTEQLPRDRVRVFCLEQTRPGFSFQVWTLARLIREVRPHVVHSRNWGASEAILAGALTHSCGLVHSEHGMESTATDPARRRILRRVIFELADRVCAVSHHLREHHAAATGFPARRITVIHNGVDTSRFRRNEAAREATRRRYGIGNGVFCMGFIGRLEPVKDPLTLLRAVEILSASTGNWRLLVAGDGSESEALKAFARSRPGIQDRISFLGELEQVQDLLNALDAYVLPSRYEGICNSLLEAMATGLPVVATAIGGNPEVIEDGVSGVLVPVADGPAFAGSLHRLATDAGLRRQLGDGALQRVSTHYSMEAMADGYERLYSAVAVRRFPRIGFAEDAPTVASRRAARVPEPSPDDPQI
jgi:sugar transferase (PEP-CTERM/EpsH1 system associated)